MTISASFFSQMTVLATDRAVFDEWTRPVLSEQETALIDEVLRAVRIRGQWLEEHWGFEGFDAVDVPRLLRQWTPRKTGAFITSLRCYGLPRTLAEKLATIADCSRTGSLSPVYRIPASRPVGRPEAVRPAMCRGCKNYCADNSYLRCAVYPKGPEAENQCKGFESRVERGDRVSVAGVSAAEQWANAVWTVARPSKELLGHWVCWNVALGIRVFAAHEVQPLSPGVGGGHSLEEIAQAWREEIAEGLK